MYSKLFKWMFFTINTLCTLTSNLLLTWMENYAAPREKTKLPLISTLKNKEKITFYHPKLYFLLHFVPQTLDFGPQTLDFGPS